MLNLLTKYLLQYRSVSIPHVGTLTLVQQPAEINFIDKILLPPTFKTEIAEEQNISEHQLNYLSAVTSGDVESTRAELDALGKTLSSEISSGVFTWNGIGVITKHKNPIPFETSSLQPLAAVRVLREDADHRILVGERERTSHEIEEEMNQPVKRQRSTTMLIGWILLGVAAIAIGYLLYKGGFSVYSSGLKTAP